VVECRKEQPLFAAEGAVEAAPIYTGRLDQIVD
jgi:hypothetical protein